MLLSKVIIKGQELEICEKASNEFGEAIENHNFDSFEEFQEILLLDDRCRNKNYFNWTPADTKTLKKFLGLEA